MSVANFNARIVDPFRIVGETQEKNETLYVNLGESPAQKGLKQIFTADKKTDATALKTLSEQFTSREHNSVGDQIRKEYAYYKDKGREGIQRIHHELNGSLTKILTHLEAHRNKIAFKIMQLLSSWFPSIFKSPEKTLLEKINYVKSMQTFLEEQFRVIPVAQDLVIQDKRNEVAKAREDLQNLDINLHRIDKCISVLKDLLDTNQKLKPENLLAWNKILEINMVLSQIPLPRVPKDHEIYKKDVYIRFGECSRKHEDLEPMLPKIASALFFLDQFKNTKEQKEKTLSTKEADLQKFVKEQVPVAQPIQQVNELLVKVRAVALDSDEASKAEKKRLLETAEGILGRACLGCVDRTHPPKELALAMAEVLTVKGQLFYNDTNFKHAGYGIARQILMQSLNLQMYAVGLRNSCIDMSVDDGDLDVEKPMEFMHEVILENPPEKVKEYAQKANLTSHQRYVLAYTYRWLGGSINNLGDKSLRTVESMTNIILSAHNLLTLDTNMDKETYEEWIELLYNDLVSFYGNILLDKTSRDSTWDTLIAEAEKHNNNSLLARVYNKRQFDFPETDLENKEKYIRKALEARLKCDNKTWGNRFHVALCQNNLASILEKKEKKNWNEIRELRESCHAFVLEAKGKYTQPYMDDIFEPNYVRSFILEAEGTLTSDHKETLASLEAAERALQYLKVGAQVLSEKIQELKKQCQPK